MLPTPPSQNAHHKVVFVGNASTGKTSIIQRYCRKTFTTDQPPTIGSAFVNQKVEVKKDDGTRDVFLQIWDTAGEERYRSLVPLYSRGAGVAIVVFDLTNRESFRDVETWIRQIQSDLGSQCGIVIAANKRDLPAEVPDTEIDKWAEGQWDLFYVSAQTGENIEKLFQRVAEKVPISVKVPAADNFEIEGERPGQACC
jgi:small GTP-binding protein